ncbi:hypothetical protein like AT1G21722 [Hibiscus trionum]|uniref:Uncharacterized protein n=2 Tax=Hibiscus trionum TaxID=183268 RepID=A0A9W7LIT7_HIBTR|nr:hypothetical protein like AT1G21722 [Hibiscus trionum]
MFSTSSFQHILSMFLGTKILKLIMALVLSYIVLLYLYLLYKVGICQCIAHSLCRMAWGCISCWFSSWEFCCTFLCYKFRNVKRINRRRRRRRVIENQFDSSEDYEDHSDNDDNGDESLSYGSRFSSRSIEVSNHSLSGRSRNYKGVHLRRSLRPRNHRIKVGISRDAVYKRKPTKHINTVHDIRVTHTSKFAHKGSSYRGRGHHSRRSL